MDFAVGSMAGLGQPANNQIPGVLSNHAPAVLQILVSDVSVVLQHLHHAALFPKLVVEGEAWRPRIPPAGALEVSAIDEVRLQD